MNIFAADVSGSMPLHILHEFIDGIKPLIHDDDRIITFEREIVQIFNPDELDGIQFKGGGGTDMDCVPQYFIDEDIHPKNSVILTDGWNPHRLEIPNPIYVLTLGEVGMKYGQSIYWSDSWMVQLAWAMK